MYLLPQAHVPPLHVACDTHLSGLLEQEAPSFITAHVKCSVNNLSSTCGCTKIYLGQDLYVHYLAM